MQVDWLSAVISAPPQLSPHYDTGHHLTIAPSGEVTQQRPAAFDVVGDEQDSSHSPRYRVMCTSPGSLYLSGNPVKLLQGHNLFGSADAFGLFFASGLWVRQRVGLFPGPSTWRSCQFEGPRFTRIDLTRSYRFPRASDAKAWIRDVAASARSRHGAAKLFGSSTAYWGMGSRRWSFKVYDKQTELLQHAKKSPIPRHLLDWSSGVVRFELTLRSLEITDNAALVAQLRGPKAVGVGRQIWQSYFDRITFNENAQMAEPTLLEDALPSHLAIKLAAWRGGKDLRSVMTKPTFYRVRRELLTAIGVDIASPPPVVRQVRTEGSALDPSGWDPEPIAANLVEPHGVSDQYGLDLEQLVPAETSCSR